MKNYLALIINVVSILIISISVNAQVQSEPEYQFGASVTLNTTTEQKNCWAHEIDPRSNNPYLNFDLWNTDLIYWLNQKPFADRSFFELSQLYIVLQEEKSPVSRISYDKAKHCYMGCRISVRINRETSYYAGWEKEREDLTDCDISTHFEFKDYEATVIGADAGANDIGHKPYTQSESQKACSDYCNSTFPKPIFN